MKHHIAFLGTGIMGAPMAANLIKAGFTATVWNRSLSKTAPLAALGARVALNPVDCVKGADYILSILDSGPVVREVFFNTKAADAMKKGAVFIDMASIPPKMAQEHAAGLKERGVGHLDAPVSGGSFGNRFSAWFSRTTRVSPSLAPRVTVRRFWLGYCDAGAADVS